MRKFIFHFYAWAMPDIKSSEFMISVSEASAIILGNLFNLQIESIDIHHVVGRILAEPIQADRDFPPFDRVSMDGIAIHSTSFKKGLRQFYIEGIQAAGTPQYKLANPDACVEVMTGAMLPQGTDAVIRYEDIEIKNGSAHVLIADVAPGLSIHSQAQDAKQNQLLLSPGQKISPAEIALLASIGKANVKVYAFPKTAIVSTGDELVAIDQTPQPHQIRRSNDAALKASLHQLGCDATSFHLPDSEEKLRNELITVFKHHDLIILSGGVSKGKFDFVPQVLESLGVKKLFHQVSQKPGKPFWFGRSEKHTVFALPGNPVSTYMCFYRYIKPWLLKSFKTDFETSSAILAEDFTFKLPLTYFLQVSVKNTDGKLLAYPDAGGGSGDFANLKDVDGFLELALEKNDFRRGEAFPYYAFR
jgi:molybdopterin molybdotransferase